MDIRRAETADRQRIREIVDQSFETSFSLSPEQIDTIVDEVFSDEALAARLEDPDVLLLVAEHRMEGETRVAGFVDVDLGEEATLRWLHVDPGARGEGIGTGLFERAHEDATDGERTFAAQILEEASEGGEFCTRFGLSRSGSDELAFDGESFFVQVFAEGGDEEWSEPTVDVPERLRIDGDDLFVDRDDEIPGTDAPFFPIYREEAHEEQYGYFCANCGSSDVSTDSLGRLECGNCGNKHLADEWDAAYL